MQGMLASFSGLEVEWRRGKVRARHGEWRAMRLGESFWRDLDWWDQQLEHSNCVPIERPARAVAAVQAGTDASDWGTGQVTWWGGGREEHRLIFTVAEKRRPINWRELLGIVRVALLGGERLRGHVVLIESDNMAAVRAAAKGSSKSEGMQELLRRLLRAAIVHGFRVKVTHTPGAKLDRPDQTSRGDPDPRFK